MSLLPTDQNSRVIQALGVKDNGAHTIAVSGTSARNATPLNAKTKIVWLYATTDMHFKTGDNTVTADTNDHFLAAGLRIPFPTKGRNYIAAVQSSSAGNLYISEAE